MLSVLSSCITAATALLNPFAWQVCSVVEIILSNIFSNMFRMQQVFIPVLPNSMLDYCCAPMPFVVGILRSSLQTVLDMPKEEVLESMR